MAGFSYGSNEHLVRSNIWSNQLKEVLLDDLIAMKYVDMIQDFPDGDTINIPSIGQSEVGDYTENSAIQYTSMDTGNFTFTVDQYKSSATYITQKMKQDAYYTAQLVASFVPKQHRALMKTIEIKILDVGPTAQTASNANTINGADHRFVATGGSDTARTVLPADFAKAKYALEKANVSMTNLVALVDPSVEYTLSTLSNLVTLQNNPKWEGIVSTGISTGMKFVCNIMGFDVYTSQNLKSIVSETITSNGARATGATAAANLFFSAAGDVLPFKGLLRQPPRVDSEFNKDLQRDEYVTTCRYGFKLYRPENLVVVLSDTNVV